MSRDATELFVKGAGDVYLAELGTEAPGEDILNDDDLLSAAGFVNYGYLNEDGPSFENYEGSNAPLRAWNTDVPVAYKTTRNEPMIVVTFIQWTVETATLFFPGATWDDEDKVLTVSRQIIRPHVAFLAVARDGDRSLGWYEPSVQPRGNGAITFPSGDELAGIPIAFDVTASADDFQLIGDLAILGEEESSSS